MPIINLSDLDRKIIAKHDYAVRARALLELEIVHGLIDAATKRGYHLYIDGEPRAKSVEDLIWQLFDLDDATLLVFEGTKDIENIGWIRLTFGNSGYDLISDYSTNLESFLKPVLGLKIQTKEKSQMRAKHAPEKFFVGLYRDVKDAVSICRYRPNDLSWLCMFWLHFKINRGWKVNLVKD